MRVNERKLSTLKGRLVHCSRPLGARVWEANSGGSAFSAYPSLCRALLGCCEALKGARESYVCVCEGEQGMNEGETIKKRDKREREE